MDNQHRKISGYRELDQTEIDLMNEVKALGTQLESTLNRVEASFGQFDPAAPESRRWLAIGKTHLQQGLMAVTRAIAKPTFF